MAVWTRARGRVTADPGLAIAVAAVSALLLLFVLYPAARVLSYPRLADYLAITSNLRWLQAARNSLLMMVISTLTATAVGFLYAFAISRRDLPLRRFFQSLSVLPLFAPPFMVAFSYILMFGKVGLVTKALLGLDVNIYGWQGLWLVQTVAFFPFAALVIGAVLEQISPTLEYAARNLGATEGGVMRTVLVPLARPGVAAAMLVVAISVLADFGNAVVIAGGFPLLATEAWFRIEGLADLNGAAVVVALLIVPTIGLFLLERFWVGRRVYTAVTGKGTRIEQPPTPAAIRWGLFAGCMVIGTLVLLVYLGVLLGSVASVWGYRWAPTLAHWRLGLAQGGAQLLTSVKIGALSAALTSVIAVVAAFLTSRRNLPFLKAIDFLAVLPAALPGVFVGVGYLLAFNAPPLILAGTPWILTLALTFWHIPLGYQAARAQLKQIDRSIEEAAQNLGAPGLRVLWDVYFPLLRPALTASFITAFIRSVTNLSIVVFLVTPRNLVATYSILAMIGGGFWGAAAALTTALLAITLAGVGLARLLLGVRLRPLGST
ncbi:MAG: ABC transporter permease [bacterium]